MSCAFKPVSPPRKNKQNNFRFDEEAREQRLPAQVVR
jgi:hypothetical protein